MFSERRQTRKEYIRMITFILTQSKCKLTSSVKNQISGCLGKQGYKERQKSRRRLWGVMDGMFIILIVVTVSWVYRFVKMYQIVHFKYIQVVCLHAKLLQLCPTLCNPMDYSLQGSSVYGILQARTLEWVAISFSYKVSYLRSRDQL